MAIRTAGTALFFIDPYDNSVNKVGCPTSLTGFSSPREQIDVSCLEDQEGKFEGGRKTPGQASIGLNLDPSDPTHLRLYELDKSGETVKWAIGWADGTADAEADSLGEWDNPATRTWLEFDAYVVDFPFDFSMNAVVTGTLPLQVTGEKVWIPKS